MVKKINPILKWAGGKRQLIPEILKLIPKNYNNYIEPFIGGGALFFYLAKNNSIINDSNEDIINLYKEVSKKPSSIIDELKKYKNDSVFFYQMRKNIPENNLKSACRTIYLNRTCFNGLYRVNKKGEFNVPYGSYKKVSFIDEENFLSASNLLKKTKILNKDYKFVLDKYAKKNDLIFLDPPYLPISKFSDFKRYTKEQFYLKDHIELGEYFKKLDKMGCHIILTNSNTEITNKVFKDFRIKIIKTKRNINSNGSNRKGEDIIVTNF